MPSNSFDRNRLHLKPLSDRKHEIDRSVIMDMEGDISRNIEEMRIINKVANRIIKAKKVGAAVIVMIGAHVIRSGVQNYLIDLMEKGYISCIAMNGACIIHDFELALIGATTESVARYIKNGQFGLWKETGKINHLVNTAFAEDKHIGMGVAIGRAIETGSFAFKEISLLAAGYRTQVPITVHVGIGYDIIHQHPNCDGAATGALSYNDFLTFTSIVSNLENGVIMNFGSAVMAPEVFLKALSMAKNVLLQEGRDIRCFTSLVCDLHRLPDDITSEASKSNPFYYFRPWKTMLVRAVANGGEGFYVQGRHDVTIPNLWHAIIRP